MSIPMQSALWAVLDTETTGPDPACARIVEVAVALFRGGVQQGPARSWLVNPGVPIPDEAAAIHGITDTMVEGAPGFAAVLPELCTAIAPADIVVGYNALHFDLPIIGREAAAIWGDDAPSLWTHTVADKPAVDPLVLVRHDSIGRYWKGPGRHRLANVCARFGIDADGAHRAAADCVMTGRLLWALGPKAGAFPGDARALAAELARLAVQQEADYQAYKARQAQ